LSQAFKSTPTKPSSADPQKEPILVETTDASKTAEDENPSTSLPDAARYLLKTLNFIQFSLFSDHLPCQTLPEETFMLEQKSDSPPVENDPIDVDTQNVEPPVQQTIDGKKVIYLVYFPTTNIIF